MKKEIFSLFIYIVISTAVSAKILPVDNLVVTGQLDNGIRYYIRHNDTPRGQASFHLVHNIGALAEEKGEYGLAHFIEHLTFQGTKNFPDQEIVCMLERQGILYGHDINARTSENETVYMLTGVPTKASATLDSCMMVMADWSYALTLDKEKIDHERSVIIEEIKMRDTPEYRQQNQWADALMKGSRYEAHDIIGTADFIRKVKPSQLRGFYQKWHRPDLEAVIVVGDFDVKEMEQRLKRIMGTVPKAKGKCPLREHYQFSRVPDQDSLRFVAVRDEGAQSNSVIVINRIDDTPIEQKNTMEYMKLNVIVRLFNILAGLRASVQASAPGSPLGGASISLYPLKRGYVSLQLGAAVNGGDEMRTLRQLMLESGRLSQVGFMVRELEWGKATLQKELDRQYNYGIIDNELIAKQLESVYLEGEPMLSNDDLYRISTEFLSKLTLNDLNLQVKEWLNTPNRTIVVTGHPTDNGLTAEDAKDIIERTTAMDYSLYPFDMPDMPSALPLMDSCTEDSASATIEPRIIIRSVPHDKGTVCLRAVRRGGLSSYDLSQLPAAEQAAMWIASAGVGKWDNQSLWQQLQLHGIECTPEIRTYSSQIIGKAMPDEAESLFQLMHLYLTQPCLDKQTIETVRQQTMMNCQPNAFEDTVRVMRSGYSPRTLLRNADYWNKATADLAIKIWQEQFGSSADFTFIITGNITESEAHRLANKYLRFTAVSYSPDSVKVYSEGGSRGKMSRLVRMNIGREIATVVCSYNLECKPTLKDMISCKLIAQAFQTRCMQNIREKEGGVYAINVNPSVDNLLSDGVFHYSVNAEFNCSPLDAERLKARVMEEWDKMVAEGIGNGEWTPVFRSLTRKMDSDDDKADVWARAIAEGIVSDMPVLSPESYCREAAKMSSDDVNDMLRRMKTEGYPIDVIFMSTQRRLSQH